MVIGIVSSRNQNLPETKTFFENVEKVISVQFNLDKNSKSQENHVVNGIKVTVLHGFGKPDYSLVDADSDVVVSIFNTDSGIFWRKGIMYLNPGHSKNTTAALLKINSKSELSAEINQLTLNFDGWEP